MAPVIALKPDALIMSDPGLIDMVRETWPEQKRSPFRTVQYRQLGCRSLLEEVRAHSNYSVTRVCRLMK
jgi:hypothetical protein